MKILHISDIHNDDETYRWLENQAASGVFDLIAIAGDLLDILAPAETWRKQMEDAEGHVVRINAKTPVALCSGNHDEWICRGWAATLPVTYPDSGCDVFACGVETVRLVRLPYECSTELSDLEPASRDVLDIWLHHEPSAMSRTSWDGAGYCGSERLQTHLRRAKPTYVLSGHIHWAPFAGGAWSERMHKTLLFNPGMGGRSTTPGHIVIDTATDFAHWFPGDRCEGHVVDAKPASFNLREDAY